MDKKPIFSMVFLIYIILLFIGALLPGSIATEIAPGNLDKVFHFVEFFVLAVLLALLLSALDSKQKLVLTMIISIMLAMLSEVVQLLVPGRTFSWLDLLSDFAGIALALAISWKSFKSKF